MKKLLLAGAVALAGLTSAQQFGVKGGLNLANVSNADGKSQAGFYAGVFMNAPLASSISIQPELLYSGKGNQYTEEGETSHQHLSYLSIPVMFQYNVMPTFYLEAGPEFSFLMSAKSKGDGESYDIKNNLNSFDFGLGFGAGYYFTPNFGATLRYVAGLIDITKDNNSNEKYHNGAFQIGLAYKFSK